MTYLSPQWLQHFYQFESTDELTRQMVFSESLAEKHALELELKRRESEPRDERTAG